MKITLAPHLQKITHTFLTEGHDLYLVGGSLRDLLLGRQPFDYDLATTALPEQVTQLFSRSLDVGRHYGTIIILEDGHQTEVTTLRQEQDYIDARHPQTVTFCTDIVQDLSRRDFTMNAMAYDLRHRQWIDPFQGQLDITQKTIRCVGDPQLRFKEDTLRIFRAARFASQLQFKIAQETTRAIMAMGDDLKLPAGERLHSEMLRLLSGPDYKTGLLYMGKWGMLPRLFPLAPDLSARRIRQTNKNFDNYQRLAQLLENTPVENLKKMLATLCFTRQEIKTILALRQNEYSYALANFCVKNLAISGLELKNLGYRGKTIGFIQRTLLAQIKQKQIVNDNVILRQIVADTFPTTRHDSDDHQR